MGFTADLTWLQGKQNMGGLIDAIYLIPKDDVDDTTLPTVLAGKLTATGNIVPKATKAFMKIDFTPGTGKIDKNSVGELRGMSVENVLEFHMSGDDVAQSEFKRAFLNSPVVAVAVDSDGVMRVLGLSVLTPTATATSLKHMAHCVQANGTTGAAAADRRGTTYQVRMNAPHDPLIYGGTVPLEAA
jgi:hypothetical protein